MQKVLVVWLWGQWQKYLNYFLKNNYQVFWACRTWVTKKKIEKEYGIEVSLDYDKFLDHPQPLLIKVGGRIETPTLTKGRLGGVIDIIIVCLPPEVQWEIALELVQKYPNIKVIVEIPVSWDAQVIEKLKKYENCIFYLEEYFTFLWQFLRKIDVSLVEKIDIQITVSKEDYENEEAAKVTHVHIMNNFLGSWIDFEKLNLTYQFHEREDIFYEVSFEYKGTRILYVFNQEKYLMVGERKYNDEYNFDFVLGKILEGGLWEGVKEEYLNYFL